MNENLQEVPPPPAGFRWELDPSLPPAGEPLRWPTNPTLEVTRGQLRLVPQPGALARPTVVSGPSTKTVLLPDC